MKDTKKAYDQLLKELDRSIRIDVARQIDINKQTANYVRKNRYETQKARREG